MITKLKNLWSLWCGQPVGNLSRVADFLVVAAHIHTPTHTPPCFSIYGYLCAQSDGKHSGHLVPVLRPASMARACVQSVSVTILEAVKQ